jgi:hypothetical protein
MTTDAPPFGRRVTTHSAASLNSEAAPNSFRPSTSAPPALKRTAEAISRHNPRTPRGLEERHYSRSPERVVHRVPSGFTKISRLAMNRMAVPRCHQIRNHSVSVRA